MTSGQGRRTEVLDHHSNHPVKSHMALCHPRPPSATLSPSQWPAKKMNPLRRHPSRLLQRITLLKSETSLKKSSGCLWFLVQSQKIVPGNYLMLALGPFTSLWWVFMIHVDLNAYKVTLHQKYWPLCFYSHYFIQKTCRLSLIWYWYGSAALAIKERQDIVLCWLLKEHIYDHKSHQSCLKSCD